MGKCGERFAYALAKLGAGNLGGCIHSVALTLGKPLPVTVSPDLMAHLSAFHIMTIAKGVYQFWSFVLSGERFLGGLFQITLLFFPFCCFTAWNLKLKNSQYISGPFHGTFFLTFVYYLITLLPFF